MNLDEASGPAATAPAAAPPSGAKRRWPWLAAILSLVFPGLGQAYGGAIRRALAFIGAAIALSLVHRWTAYAWPPQAASAWVAAEGAALAGSVFVPLCAAADAFFLARRRRAVVLRRYNRIWCYTALAIAGWVPGMMLSAAPNWRAWLVPSASMQPTLLVGDYVLAPSGWFERHAPQRGDLVFFKLPRDPSVHFLKRVVGLPGDRIQMRQGVLFIDDAAVTRAPAAPYATADGRRYLQYVETLPGGPSYRIIATDGQTWLDDTPLFAVPPGHYFMLGDNRNNSADSRDPNSGVGYVPAANLETRLGFVYFSLDERAHWWEIWRWRWQRLGLRPE